MAKKRRKARPSPKPRDEPAVVRLVEYEITSEPIQDRFFRQLPRRVKDAFERLHDEAQEQPHKAIPELLEWIEKYPTLPMLYNYLSVAYSRAGEREKRDEIIRENYARNPDYLFARLNYAELCLARGDYDEIAQIFEHKFDLGLLYPKRKRFHISEVVNFMGLAGAYYVETGEREVAQVYYDILEQIAPEYPMTESLRRRLHPGPFGRLLRRLAGRRKSDSS